MRFRKSLPPELARPIPHPDGPGAPSYLVREWIKRFRLLLKHYGIKESEPDRWASLLFELARDCIPGFQLEKANKNRGGRPKKRAIRISRRVLQALKRETFYKNLIHFHEIGEVQLRKRGMRVTRKGAVEAGIRHFYADLGVTLSEREIRNKTSEWAKRLPEAEKFVQKLSKT
jgi:hypothetical protein